MDLLQLQAVVAAIGQPLNYVQSQAPDALEHISGVAPAAAIEQSLNYIQSQGPDALEYLKLVLLALKAGAVSIAGVSTLISQWPIFIEAINRLLILINSGAGIPEIAAQLAAWAQAVGASVDVLLQLLYTLGGILALF